VIRIKHEVHILTVVALVTLASPVAALAQSYGSPPPPVPPGSCNLAGAPITTLRDPLINGASSEPPLVTAPGGQPPPIGNGPVPVGITPGMVVPPTTIPSVPVLPANNIEYGSYRVPFDPSTQSYPYTLGQQMSVPPPPSTPGCDPGNLTAPYGSFNPAVDVYVNPDGGLPDQIPWARRGGQQSHDWGWYKHIGTRSFDFAQEQCGSESLDGLNHERGGSSVVQDLYGRRCPTRNNGGAIVQTIAPY
jgi:hypothetical protein